MYNSAPAACCWFLRSVHAHERGVLIEVNPHVQALLGAHGCVPLAELCCVTVLMAFILPDAGLLLRIRSVNRSKNLLKVAKVCRRPCLAPGKE